MAFEMTIDPLLASNGVGIALGSTEQQQADQQPAGMNISLDAMKQVLALMQEGGLAFYDRDFQKQVVTNEALNEPTQGKAADKEPQEGRAAEDRAAATEAYYKAANATDLRTVGAFGQSLSPEEQDRIGDRQAMESVARRLEGADIGADRLPEVVAKLKQEVAADLADGNSVSGYRFQSDVANLAKMTGTSLAALGVAADDMPRNEYIGMGMPSPDPVTAQTRPAFENQQAINALQTQEMQALPAFG